MEKSIASPVNAGKSSVAGIQVNRVTEQLIDLNAVTQKAFIATDPIQRSKITLRCDELPQVYADESKMLRLFQLVVQMILECSVPESSLFIYIKSGLATEEPLESKWGKQNVKISICSNVNGCEEWKAQQMKALEECTLLCKGVNGHFTFFPPGQTGVLFSITLPGKLNTTSLG